MSFDDFDGGEDCYAEPPTMSSWAVQMNDETKHFTYGDNCETPQIIEELRALEDFFHEIVSSRDEYQALPDAVCGYI